MAFSKHLSTTVAIAARVNDLLSQRFQRKGTAVMRFKDYASIVTAVDMAANRQVVRALKKNFPNDTIVSEEGEAIQHFKTSVWYVDPLDGTSNFAYGLPEFTTCFARITNSNPELGVIGIPIMGEIFAAETGKGAYRNGRRIQLPKNMMAKEPFCLLGTSRSPADERRFKAFVRRADLKHLRIRLLGSTALNLTAVASGQADACIIMNVEPWDVLAGVILVREAGGTVTNFQGKEWTLGDRTFIAAHPDVHGTILNITKYIL